MNRAAFLVAITIAICAPSPNAAAQVPLVRADTGLMQKQSVTPHEFLDLKTIVEGTRQHVTQAEDSTVRHRHVGLGLGLGFLVGTVAGIAIEAAGKHGEDRTLSELGGAIGGAVVGTIIGGTVGFFWRTGK